MIAVLDLTDNSLSSAPCGEDRETLLSQVAQHYGVGPLDSVEMMPKRGRLQYAIIEQGTTVGESDR